VVFLPQTGEIGLSWRSFPLDIIALVCQRFLTPVETMARGRAGNSSSCSQRVDRRNGALRLNPDTAFDLEPR
jgi:hypothetical protein